MPKRRRGAVLVGWLLLSLLPMSPARLFAQSVQPGKNVVTIRGQQQEVYFYPGGGAASTPRPKILFAPGDGGWHGFAITLAEKMASWGYDVYGLDTKQYLESFTGKTTLQETDVMSDMRQLAQWMAPGGKERVRLVGWSEGAGLMLLAAAPPENKSRFSGLITMGLGNANVLGWRWKDDVTYVTKQKPNEPGFSSFAFAARVAPLPLAMMQSSHDEYVSQDEARKIFEAAREPKRFVPVDARDHRFDGNLPEFFTRLREALQWLDQTTP